MSVWNVIGINLFSLLLRCFNLVQRVGVTSVSLFERTHPSPNSLYSMFPVFRSCSKIAHRLLTDLMDVCVFWSHIKVEVPTLIVQQADMELQRLRGACSMSLQNSGVVLTNMCGWTVTLFSFWGDESFPHEMNHTWSFLSCLSLTGQSKRDDVLHSTAQSKRNLLCHVFFFLESWSLSCCLV